MPVGGERGYAVPAPMASDVLRCALRCAYHEPKTDAVFAELMYQLDRVPDRAG